MKVNIKTGKGKLKKIKKSLQITIQEQSQKKKLRKIILPNITTISEILNYNMTILKIKYNPILELYLRKY